MIINALIASQWPGASTMNALTYFDRRRCLSAKDVDVGPLKFN